MSPRLLSREWVGVACLNIEGMKNCLVLLANLVAIGTLPAPLITVTVQLNHGSASFIVNVSGVDDAAAARDPTPSGTLVEQVDQTCAAVDATDDECKHLLEYVSRRAQIMAGRSTNEIDRARYFSDIYRWNIWGAASNVPADEVSRSGAGSTRAAGLKAISALELVLDRYPVRTLLDVPCGDLTWMPLDRLRARGVAYTGADIVPQIVEDNRRLAAAAGYRLAEFLVMDIVSTPIPARFDAIFMRDLFYHMTTPDVLRVLRNVERSNATLFVAKTSLRANNNLDDFVLAFGHQVNLFERPFCLRDPAYLVRDYNEDTYIGVWELLQPEHPAAAPADGRLPLLGWNDGAAAEGAVRCRGAAGSAAAPAA